MTAKEYLSQYRESMTRTKELTAHLLELREAAENLIDSEGHTIRLDVKVAELVDAQSETNSEIEKLCALRKCIVEIIDGVQDGTKRYILYHKYILGESLERIAADMHYHYVSVCRIHGQALKSIELPKDVIDC